MVGWCVGLWVGARGKEEEKEESSRRGRGRGVFLAKKPDADSGIRPGGVLGSARLRKWVTGQRVTSGRASASKKEMKSERQSAHTHAYTHSGWQSGGDKSQIRSHCGEPRRPTGRLADHGPGVDDNLAITSGRVGLTGLNQLMKHTRNGGLGGVKRRWVGGEVVYR